MARDRPARPDLAGRIATLAERLAFDVVDLVRAAALDELIELARGDLPAARRATRSVPAPRAAATNGTASEAAAPRRRRWPSCSQPDCGGAYYPASGTAHLCYRHFLAAGGQHPSRLRKGPAPG